MSEFMNKDAYREKLKAITDHKPTRLEKRLARVELAAHEAAGTFETADFSNGFPSGWAKAINFIWQTLVFIFMIIGTFAALVPTLLWLGVTMIPALLLVGCFSQF